MRILFRLSKRPPPISRLRMTCIMPVLEQKGWACTVLPIPSDHIGRVRMIRACARHDVVVRQKKTSLHGPELSLMRRANPNLVFDFDDAVMFHELEHGRPLRARSFAKFLRTVETCRAVVAGNEFLASFARPICSDVHVLPTPMDTERYTPRRHAAARDGVTIGWLGTPGGLPHVAALGDVFRTVAEKVAGFCLKIVSSEFIDLPGVEVVKKRYNMEEEIADLQSFDVGIMPLQDNLWTRGKCGFKMLQYVGVGVPAIASPVGIDVELIRQGETGFLAADAEAWQDALLTLAVDTNLRHRMGTAGRRRVVERFSQARHNTAYARLLNKVASA